LDDDDGAGGVAIAEEEDDDEGPVPPVGEMSCLMVARARLTLFAVWLEKEEESVRIEPILAIWLRCLN
jgi:hypothetical protein